MGDVNRTIIFDTIISGGTGGTGSTCCNIINFDIDATAKDVTYLGYGEELECKILKVETLSGSTYNSFWSNGEETLDKIWDNRDTYSYF